MNESNGFLIFQCFGLRLLQKNLFWEVGIITIAAGDYGNHFEDFAFWSLNNNNNNNC